MGKLRGLNQVFMAPQWDRSLLTSDDQSSAPPAKTFRGERKQLWNILQLKGGSEPRALGWRSQGLLAREVSLWAVRLRRGFQGPSATESEGHFLSCLFFPTVRSRAVEKNVGHEADLTVGPASVLG